MAVNRKAIAALSTLVIILGISFMISRNHRNTGSDVEILMDAGNFPPALQDMSRPMHSKPDIQYVLASESQTTVNNTTQHIDDKVPDDTRKDDMTRCSSAERSTHLKTVCDRMNLTDARIQWDNLGEKYWIVDHVHKMFICMIPKSASHSMRSLLGTPIVGKLNSSVLYPMRNYLRATGFEYLYEIPTKQRQQILRDYLKVVVVRHPLDRLKSAYMNKMKKPGGLNSQVLMASIDIINEYLHKKGRLDKNSRFNPMKDTITFEEFIELIATNTPSFQNEHWGTFYDTCRPCSIHYDTIMRLETLESDVTTIYDHMTNNADKNLPEGNMDPNIPPNQKLNMVKEFFKDIPSTLFDKILRIYRKDFKMFGYTWSTENGAACTVPRDTPGHSCC